MPKDEIKGELSYYIVIPGFIRADKKLSPFAKLLYGEVAIKCVLRGHCFASNQYFADAFECNVRSIQRYMKELEDAGHIVLSLEKTGDGTDRKIFLTEAGRQTTDLSRGHTTDLSHPYDSPVIPPRDKSVTRINKSSYKEEIKKNSTNKPLGLLVPVDDKTKQPKQKKPDKKPSPPPTIYPKFIEIYNNWFKDQNDGIPVKMDGANGNAAKSIIAYFRTVVRSKAVDKNIILDSDGEDKKILESWDYVLRNWKNIDLWMQDKTKLTAINSNIQDILKQIKNGTSKSVKDKNEANNNFQSGPPLKRLG